jgi:hypothetical protein
VITDILAALTAERDRLNLAIAILQSAGAPKRRGRPPKNPLAALMAPAIQPKATRARPKRTKAQREAQAERMRKYWAARKKEKVRAGKSKKRDAKVSTTDVS